jgi:orotate phosphoribosyltransferase
LLVDDAVSSGASVERFSAALADVGAEVAGVFVVVDMRDVAPNVADVACALPIAAATTYLELLDVATANAVLEPDVRDLSVQAMVQHWTADDPRWQQLPLVR